MSYSHYSTFARRGRRWLRSFRKRSPRARSRRTPLPYKHHTSNRLCSAIKVFDLNDTPTWLAQMHKRKEQAQRAGKDKRAWRLLASSREFSIESMPLKQVAGLSRSSTKRLSKRRGVSRSPLRKAALALLLFVAVLLFKVQARAACAVDSQNGLVVPDVPRCC